MTARDEIRAAAHENGWTLLIGFGDRFQRDSVVVGVGYTGGGAVSYADRLFPGRPREHAAPRKREQVLRWLSAPREVR